MQTNKLKFLMYSFWDAGLATINYMIVSFNYIWMRYYSAKKKNNIHLIRTCCRLSSHIDVNSRRFKEIHHLYELNDLEKLKEKLFGRIENIELYAESAVLGVTGNGNEIVVSASGDIIWLQEKEGFTGSTKYDNIQAKLALAGKELDIGILDSGYACDIRAMNWFKYLNTIDCIAFIAKDVMLKNAEFNYICTQSNSFINCTGIKINSLVQAYIWEIVNCELSIENTLFIELLQIANSKINFGTVSNLEVRDIVNSHIVFDEVINDIKFLPSSKLEGSKIEFKCGLVKAKLLRGLSRCVVLDGSEFIFRGKVSVTLLAGLIDSLESISEAFKIVLDDKVYTECMHKLDEGHARYLVRGE